MKDEGCGGHESIAGRWCPTRTSRYATPMIAGSPVVEGGDLGSWAGAG